MQKQPRIPRLLQLYERYLQDRDVPAFLAAASPYYNPGTLERLLQHWRREVRRAAAFALGLLGQYQSNHALGCALLDGDRTVRLLAEHSIRCVWMRVGTPPEQRELELLVRLGLFVSLRKSFAAPRGC